MLSTNGRFLRKMANGDFQSCVRTLSSPQLKTKAFNAR